ncbi:MAG: TRAP transporter large permease subunit [Deltaproteobacteria bacterium]|nr:TRAP transporter large permease subunit [Deltaproteobacteria bacterium]
MSPELTTILMILSLFILLAGFPLAFGVGSMGLLFGFLTSGEAFLYMIPQRVVSGILSEYIFAAVPLFIFMGTMMQTSGVAERAYQVLHRWMSGVNGGLGVATIMLAMLFAATTGVVGASETAVGLLAIPSMLKARYAPSLAAGCVCAGGTLGILIPPSIMLILYAPMAGVSVIQMFAGAVIPGLMLGFGYIIYVLIRSAINPALGPHLPPEEKLQFFSKESVGMAVTDLLPPLGIILLVLGSIFFGVASPTEAGAVGALGTTVMALAYKRLTWQSLKENCYMTIRITSMIIVIAIASNLFTGAFLNAGCGQVITDFLLSLGLGKWGIFITILTIIFFLGMFIDWIGILLITIPIFSPILLSLGFDPLWVGLVVCISLQISFLTPPFAYSIFYLKGIAPEIELIEMYKGIIPFVFIQIAVTILAVAFPGLCLWLPKLLAS